MRRIMVMLFVIILAAAFVLMMSGSLLAERGLSEGVLKIINDPLYKGSSWGILVKDLESGEVIYELNMDKLFVPASTTKLFTMTAGLDTFGPDYRFQTPIYRRGEVDSQGTLYGDLILVASGDLTMGGRTIADERIAYTNMDHTEAGMDGVFEAILTRTDPVSFARMLLIEALERAGVKVEAAPSGVNPFHKLLKGEGYKEAERVALLVSPPYGELVKLILKVSHNLGADTTPLLIAVKNGKKTLEEGLAGYMTTAKGRELVFALYVNNTPMQTVDDLGRIGSDQGRICEVMYTNN